MTIAEMFADKLRKEGEARGEARGKAEGVLAVLEARGLAVTAEQRACILACADVARLVIGKRKFSYDLWGDAVNTASRLESHGLPDEIQISSDVRDRLGDGFLCEERGPVSLKGKGELITYWLRGTSP